jgi:DNA polymerase I-like protein with 3'-5' exonuclease and polymerase domains
MSGSKLMREHCERSLYPDEGYDEKGNKVKGGKFPHPNYYDIHSNVAVLAFQLPCQPTKGGLKSIGKSHFRVLAKNVIFGIAYGRGAKAIALQAKEQGVNVTVDEAQQVIDTIFEMYPELVPFFEEAKARALNEKWLCNCFGAFRRFPTTSDFKMEGEFERQAMNFPIQSMIASCVDRGLAWLHHEIERQGLGDDIRLLLQIHDAGLVECKYELVPYAIKLIKWAMVDQVEIWPSNLAGEATGEGPFHLGLDFVVEKQWSEKFSDEERKELGLPDSEEIMAMAV